MARPGPDAVDPAEDDDVGAALGADTGDVAEDVDLPLGGRDPGPSAHPFRGRGPLRSTNCWLGRRLDCGSGNMLASSFKAGPPLVRSGTEWVVIDREEGSGQDSCEGGLHCLSHRR